MGVDGATDLLSTEEMLTGPRAASIREWKRKELDAGGLVGSNSLVIGMSNITPTKLLLDPERTGANGEWAVVQYHHEEEGDYPSFLIWLEDSIIEFQELLREEREGSSEG
jgi:hypothetical protein